MTDVPRDPIYNLPLDATLRLQELREKLRRLEAEAKK